MDLRVKLRILADAAKYDASCASSGARRRNAPSQGRLGDATEVGICHSYTPDGRCVSLLKILLTNHCIYDCRYCVNRASSGTPRARFTVEEVVYLTVEFYRRNYIEGLFLSSGIIQSNDYTMQQLAAVARKLREEERFGGYIHLKATPNAAPELLAEAGRYADRLSCNVELPTASDLRALAPEKELAQIERTMSELRWRIAEARQPPATGGRSAPEPFAPGGQSTQMIVGATPSPDATVLATAERLYRTQKLRRVYYSAYSPIPHGDDRLPPTAPPLVREHRLYQADWLMRFYGFDAGELTTPGQPNLDLGLDPKLAWALRHRALFPVDLNAAPRERLLRVPGLGVRNVGRILKIRRHHAVTLDDLSRLRVPLNKARPWVQTADHNPALRLLDRDDLADRLFAASTGPRSDRQRQMELFAGSSVTGEL